MCRGIKGFFSLCVSLIHLNTIDPLQARVQEAEIRTLTNPLSFLLQISTHNFPITSGGTFFCHHSSTSCTAVEGSTSHCIPPREHLEICVGCSDFLVKAEWMKRVAFIRVGNVKQSVFSVQHSILPTENLLLYITSNI